MRNWAVEWEQLNAIERAAFEQREALFSRTRPYFAEYGAPPLRLVETAISAEEKWQKAREGVAQFIMEYRRAGLR